MKYMVLMLLQAVHMVGQLGLQVGGFVLMDDMALGQFVEHSNHFRIKIRGFLFVSGLSQLLNRITRCLCIITIMQPSLLGLSDSLQC